VRLFFVEVGLNILTNRQLLLLDTQKGDCLLWQTGDVAGLSEIRWLTQAYFPAEAQSITNHIKTKKDLSF